MALQYTYFLKLKHTLKLVVIFAIVLSSQKGFAQCTNLSLYATSSALSCLSGLTSGTVNVLNGIPPYTYTWLPSGGNASVAINIPPASYTIIAKDANGCTGTTQLIIYNTSPVTIQFSNIPNTCFGQNIGQITANVTGASPPLNYIWTPAAPNSSVITNLAAGVYSLAVTDGIGCTHTGTTIVTQPSSITVNVATKTIACNGGLSGATVTATGGVPNLSYSWTPIVSTNSIVNNLPAGNYSVTVKDANGCSQVTPVTITEPPAMQNSLTLTHVSCNSYSNGAASSNITGGTPAYSYTWLPINVNASSVGGMTAGSYTLLVKDVKGCSITQTFNINQPAPITQTISFTNEFCINADGSATVNVSGGNGSYTYTWSTIPVQTGSVATNLAAGNYSVQIADSKNCQSQGFVTIGNTSNLIASITSQTNTTCFGSCNGSVKAGISGGVAPYSYNWLGVSNGTNQAVSNLCAGNYTVKITDNTGCYATTTVQITEPTQLTYSIGGNNIICSGNTTTLSSTVSGGTPSYSYNWLPGNLHGASINVNPSSTTVYTLTVTDAKGCSGTSAMYSVLVNAPLSINASASTIHVCPNINTSISVTANGGDGNYTYSWMPGNLTANSITVNVQSTTIYTVTISDGCGSTPISNTVNVSVYPIASPSFAVSATKGCEPFCVQFNNLTTGTTTALWTFGDFSAPVQSPVTTHCYNKAGTYDVKLTVTNMYGCQSSSTKTDYITVYPKPIADFTQKPKYITLVNNKGIFENSSVNANTFKWSLDGLNLSNDQDLEHQFFEAGCFNLQLIAYSGNACTDTTNREICVTEGFNFWMPNCFTPDDDDHNDFLYPKGTGWDANGYSFEIFDRWGNSIFKTNDINAVWDGKVGGTKATDEIYVWKVFIKDIYDNEHDLNGHVMIMR